MTYFQEKAHAFKAGAILVIALGRYQARYVSGVLFLASSMLVLNAAPTPEYGGKLSCGAFELHAPSPFPVPESFHTRAFASACFEGLTRLDADGEVIPGVATDWYTEDSRTWRFQLALDVTFHDGQPVTTADIRQAWEYTLRLRGARVLTWPLWCIAGAEEFLSGEAQHVSGIRTLTDARLEVELSEPCPVFPEALAQPAAWIARQESGAWMGTGPFEIIEWNTDNIRLGRWDAYRWGRSYLDAIDLVYYPETRRARAAFDFEVGTRQMLWDTESGRDVPLHICLEISPTASSQSNWYRAIRYAIDVEALLRLRQIASPAQMRFLGEKVENHPAWQPYRPFKAYRMVRLADGDEAGLHSLAFAPLPGRSGTAVARRIERGPTDAGIRSRLVMDSGDSASDLYLLPIEFSGDLLGQIEPGPGVHPLLILYRDALKVQVSDSLRGWHLTGGRPAWESLWFAR